MSKVNIKIILIFLIASFLYFYKIDKIPNGVYSDEATIGYNANSILQTGKDEYGQPFPIAFRFFGAYTPPLFVYLSIPFIKIFGNNIISLRIISGISTLVGIFLIYYFSNKLNLFKSKLSSHIAIIIFSITPWVIFNARLGYEVTFGYIFFSLGLFLVWEKLINNKISIAGLTILSISTYIGHTQRYLFPLFLLGYVLLFKLKLKSLIKPLIIIIFTQIPNIILMTTPAFWVKNNAYNNTGFLQLISDFITQLTIYLSPKNIFGLSPDINLQHTIPHISLFYSWLIIPFFIGLYHLYKDIRTINGRFLFYILLIAPIPGSLSGHFISIQRVLSLIIPLVLIISLGFDYLLQKKPKITLIGFMALSLFSLLLFWRSYFIFLPQQRAVWWSYGYQQLSQEIKERPTQKFIIDNTRDPSIYMILLYHLKYPSTSLPTLVGYYDNPTFSGNYQLDNIEIRPIYWKKDIYLDQILVGDSLAISESQAKEHYLERIIEIKDPLGNVIIVGYQTNPKLKLGLD